MHIKPSLIIRPTWLPCVNVVKVQSHDFSKGFNPNDHYCSQHNNSLYWSGKAREFPIHWPSPLAGWQLHCLGSLHSASLWQFSAILPLPSQPINTTLNTDTHLQQDPCPVHQERTCRQVAPQHTVELLSFLCAQHVWHQYLNTQRPDNARLTASQ